MSFRRFLIIPVLICLVSVSCSGESDEFLFKKGQDLWSRGKVDESLNQFLNLVEKYPSSDLYDDALFKIGELYYLSYNDFPNAIKYFRQVLLAKQSRSKLKFQSQSYIAEIYENSLNDYDQAIIEYQRLSNSFASWISPDTGQYKIAGCYYKKGDYKQAIVEYEILVERFPMSLLVEESIYQMVTSNFILGDCSQAVNKYNIFKKKFPGSRFMPEIEYEIGSCYEEEGKLLKSIKIFRKLKDSYSNKKLIEMKIDSIEKRLAARKR